MYVFNLFIILFKIGSYFWYVLFQLCTGIGSTKVFVKNGRLGVGASSSLNLLKGVQAFF